MSAAAYFSMHHPTWHSPSPHPRCRSSSVSGRMQQSDSSADKKCKLSNKIVKVFSRGGHAPSESRDLRHIHELLQTKSHPHNAIDKHYKSRPRLREAICARDRGTGNNSNGISEQAAADASRQQVLLKGQWNSAKGWQNTFGCYALPGEKPLNPDWRCQDSCLVVAPFGDAIGDDVLLAVLDGHGPEGGCVSWECMKRLPEYLSNTEIKSAFPLMFHQTCLSLHRELVLGGAMGVNCDYSGTTLVAAVVSPCDRKLKIWHVGDSRAVMLYREKGAVKVRQLTWDHKPNLPDELQHICKNGGIVYPLEDIESGNGLPKQALGSRLQQSRVWSANAKRPGLAMSRSIGDRHAHDCGVREVPDVLEADLNIPAKSGDDGDVCLLLATDGVWDVLSHSEIIVLTDKRQDGLTWSPSDLCESICLTAKERWKGLGTFGSDDCSCVAMRITGILENRKE